LTWIDQDRLGMSLKARLGWVCRNGLMRFGKKWLVPRAGWIGLGMSHGLETAGFKEDFFGAAWREWGWHVEMGRLGKV